MRTEIYSIIVKLCYKSFKLNYPFATIICKSNLKMKKALSLKQVTFAIVAKHLTASNDTHLCFFYILESLYLTDYS